MKYTLVESMSSSVEIDKQIADACAFIEKLKMRREVVVQEENELKLKRWAGLGEVVEAAVGGEVDPAVFREWMASSSGSLHERIAMRTLANQDLSADREKKTVVDDPELDEFVVGDLEARANKVDLLAEAIRRAGVVEETVEKPAAVQESPKQVTARLMRELLPSVSLSRAHINELIQAADHGVSYETIEALANPELSLQQVRAARAAAERQLSAA